MHVSSKGITAYHEVAGDRDNCLQPCRRQKGIETMLRHIVCAIALPIALMLTGSATADPTTECGVGSSSQVEIGACLEEVGRKADASLDIILGFVRKSAAETDTATGRALSVPALEAGQKQWSLYRDQHCEFVGTTFGGGSGTGIAILDCRIELTRARERELMQFVQ